MYRTVSLHETAETARRLPTITTHADKRLSTRLWHLSRLEQKPVFNETWISDSTCVGHNADDIQPFHDLFLEEHEGETPDVGSAGGGSVGPLKGYYTNAELYDLLHPGEMELPYVYDNFAWPHCDVSGGGCPSLLVPYLLMTSSLCCS